jgi:DNA-directed RNA polymerase specialized sigma24 family protein
MAARVDFCRPMNPPPEEPESVWCIPFEFGDSRTTRSHFIEAFGRRKTVSEWAEETKQPALSIARRIAVGKTPEEALRPRSAKGPDPRRYPFRGEARSLKEISALAGVNLKTMQTRLYRGWSLEEACASS